jgi:hypothetical protein
MVIVFHLLNQRSELSSQFLLFLSDLSQIYNSFFILFINTNFVFPDKLKVFVEFFGTGCENFSDLVMTRLSDVIAHFNDQLNVSSAFFETFYGT